MEQINVKTTQSSGSSFDCFDTNVWHLFSKANLFTFCCIAAFLSLVTYLGAFSCEVSWLLEAHGDLPIYAYLLCSGYFIMFVASTILIHGLATGLSWGLFSWSIMVGILSIPELVFVMIMTTQYWGLQSIHGLTEIISYLVRLVINCMALMCVIPTGLRWRREHQIMSQLENLANRMHLTSPENLQRLAAPSALTCINDSTRRKSLSRKRRPSQSSAYDNPAFISISAPQQSNHSNSNSSKNRQPQITLPIFPYYYGMYPSQNEFNASIFGLDPSHLVGPLPQISASKRTQSLLDFRHIIPASIPPHMQNMYGSKTQVTDLDQPDGGNPIFNNEKPEPKRSSHSRPNKNGLSDDEKRSIAGDPIYQTISSEKTAKALSRNCISLENLRTLTIKNDLNNYGNNLLQNHDMNNVNSGYYMLPSFPPPSIPTPYHHYMTHKVPQYMIVPSMPMHPHHHQQQQQQQQQQQAMMRPDYRMAFTNYGGYPHPNPYVIGSHANSRQSIGNESDDYRKYRDVAL